MSKEKKKGSCLKTILMVICVFVILAAIGSIIGDDEKKEKNDTTAKNTTESTATEDNTEKEETEPQEEIMEIDPNTLLTDYEANEVRGDELYNGKMMRLTGTVGSIGKDILEEVYITFANADEYKITSVQCYFSDDDQIKKVMELSEGDSITLVGKCDGKFGNVVLKDCYFE